MIVDDTCSSPELQQKFQKYKKENLRVLQQSVLDKEYLKLYDTPEGFDGAFKKLADTVADLISKSLEKDEKILLLSSDQDNIGAAIVIYFMMKAYKFSYTAAMGLIRERRISIKLEKK